MLEPLGQFIVRTGLLAEVAPKPHPCLGPSCLDSRPFWPRFWPEPYHFGKRSGAHGLAPFVVGQDRSETKQIGLGLGFVLHTVVLVLAWSCTLWSWSWLGLAHCGLGLAHCGLGLGLAGLVLCCETQSCHARPHNDSEGHNNFSSTI